MRNELLKYKLLFASLFIIISSLFTVLYIQTIYQEYTTMEKLALEQAKASFNKDLAYRRWASEIGGVYVLLSGNIQPNPYLKVDEREITSTTGKTYTLVNPAYMTRMVHELAWDQYKMKGHIASLKAVNPKNNPDEWEKKVLKKFEQGEKDYYSIEKEDGNNYLRYMGPMVTEEACLKCHAYQGYKTGDIKGGISISVPLNEYELIYHSAVLKHSLIFGVVFLFSILLIFIAYRVISREVKKRMLIQKKELEYGERHKKIIQSAIDGFIEIQKNGKITDANEAYCKMSGYTKDELLGMNLSQLEYLKETTDQKEYMHKVREEGKERFESIHIKKDGSLINIEVSALAEPYENDKIVSFIKNITVTKIAEKELIESEKKYRQLFENMAEAFALHKVIKDSKGEVIDYEFIDVNPKFEELTGLKKENLVEKSVLEAIPGTEKYWIERYGKVAITGEPIEFTNFSKELNKHYHVKAYSPDKNYFAVIFSDITLQKEAENAIKESEEKYRQVFESTGTSNAIFDKEMRLVLQNSLSKKNLGVDDDEMIGKTVKEVFGETAGLKVEERMKRIYQSGIGEHFETKFELPTGTRWFSTAYQPMKEDNEVIAIQTISQDITDKKIMEEALVKSEERFRKIIEHAPDAVYLHDFEGRIIATNHKACINIGYTRDELENMNVIDIETAYVKIEDLKEVWKNIEENKSVLIEGNHRRKDGSIFPVEVHISQIYIGEKEHYIAFVHDLSNRVKAENALRESEKRYRRIIESANDAILIANVVDGYIVDVNAKAEELLGLKRNEIIGMHQMDLHPTEVEETIKESFRRNSRSEKPVMLETFVQNVSGDIIPVEISPSKVNFDDGKEYLIGFFRDIRERKDAEAELIAALHKADENDEKHRFLFENMTQGVVYHDSSGEIIYANSSAAKILGVTIEQLKGQISLNPRWNSIKEDETDYPGEVHPVMVTLKTGKPVKNERMGVFIPEENKYRWININSIPIYKDHKEKVDQVLVTFEDITAIIEAKNELKQAIVKLEESEKKYRNLVETAQELIWKCDSHGNYIYLNKAWETTFGYKLEEMLGKSFGKFQTEEDFQKDMSTFIKLMEGGSIKNYETIHIAKDGTKKSLLFNAIHVTDEEGNVVGTQGTATDITLLKKHEQELIEAKQKAEENETKFRTLFENSKDAIGLSLKGICIFFNQAFVTLFGYESNDELIGKSLLKLVAPKERKRIAEYVKRRTEGLPVPFSYETVGLRKNGEEFEFDVKIAEIIWDNEPHNMVIIRDITERKRQEKELKKHRNHLEQLVKERTDELESSNEELKSTNEELYKQRDELEQTIKKLNETQSQLVQAEKMASLGVLVAGVAHEINNPVNFINSSINGLKNNLNYLLEFTYLYQQLSEDNLEVIKEINKRQKDATLSEVLEMFKRSIEIIEVGIERTTKIVKSLKSFARSDEKELSSYNVNENIDNTLLILYHQYKKRVEIIKEYEQLPLIVCYPGQINQVIMNLLTNAIQSIREKGEIKIITKMVNLDCISISIEDTGVGINRKDLKHIFDPFFTTKEVGTGTGLGLSISYNIIKEHRGKIEVTSEKGKGSCFTVTIPVKHE